jgi:NAD(P)-dependent dehydrogenase (short-subunit alcohol dehydrogenase family)
MEQAPFWENVVVITGASRGIGRELALQLADQGAWLALGARETDRLEAVANECRQRGGRAVAIRTDVGSESDCQELIRCTAEEYGRLDTLINNAGVSMWARFEDVQTLEPFDTIMRVNYLGTVYCTYYALPWLKKARGRIVGVSSAAGKNGVPTRSAYSASKHAMVGLLDTLRIELSSYGISVTIVYPDFVTSDIRRSAFGADGKPLGHSPVQEARVMPTDVCARLILEAAAKRKRELLMSPRSRVGVWLKLIAPGLVDRIALNAIQRGR